MDSKGAWTLIKWTNKQAKFFLFDCGMATVIVVLAVSLYYVNIEDKID